ncbi:hypothetical protein GCM10010428_17880 [Actinosynnema pretiosum subsp. pretiosum]
MALPEAVDLSGTDEPALDSVLGEHGGELHRLRAVLSEDPFNAGINFSGHVSRST